ncbi:MAG: ABC transporter ATP-binding protein [bacterium]
MSDFLLETIELKKSFISPSGELLEIIKGVSFTVKTGDTVSIVGMSGAGKTTFLHLLGLLDKPTEGKVIYFGKDVTELKEEELASFRNNNIGFVFQFHYLLPEFTALENAVMPLIIRGVPFKEAKERGMELFKKVNLEERAMHKPGQLSGGEQQRVAVIRAFIGEPAIILADEPTGNLDKKNARNITELFLKLNEEHKTSLVLVTHNDELASMMKTKYKIDDGMLVSL